jgi:hypothetical protein
MDSPLAAARQGRDSGGRRPQARQPVRILKRLHEVEKVSFDRMSIRQLTEGCMTATGPRSIWDGP